MLTLDQKVTIINTFHSLTLLNFSPVLDSVSQSEFFVMIAVEKMSEYNKKNTGRVSSIAESLHVSSPAISRTITSLENKGYAERCVDIQNRRNTGVKLTEEGRKVYLQECENVCRVFNEVTESMGEEKITQLITLADELRISFEDALSKSKNKA